MVFECGCQVAVGDAVAREHTEGFRKKIPGLLYAASGAEGPALGVIFQFYGACLVAQMVADAFGQIAQRDCGIVYSVYRQQLKRVFYDRPVHQPHHGFGRIAGQRP